MVATKGCAKGKTSNVELLKSFPVCSQPLQLTNYKIAPVYSGLIMYMLQLYDAITYDYG